MCLIHLLHSNVMLSNTFPGNAVHFITQQNLNPAEGEF